MGLRRQTALVGATMSVMAMSAQAGLIATDGGLGVYDTTNNVTWTSDANLMATQAASYGSGAAAYVNAIIAASGGVIHDTPNINDPSGMYTLSASDFVTSTGTMDYWGARAWVNYLNATNYGGSHRWALPTTVDSVSSLGNPDGAAGNPAINSSQLAQLFYGGLGQVAGSSITTTHNGAYSLFSNVQSYLYWSGTEYSANPYDVWGFSTGMGVQDAYDNLNDFYALAVSPGPVVTVPEPGVTWLLGSGLVGLLGLSRRKAETSALR